MNTKNYALWGIALVALSCVSGVVLSSPNILITIFSLSDLTLLSANWALSLNSQAFLGIILLVSVAVAIWSLFYIVEAARFKLALYFSFNLGFIMSIVLLVISNSLFSVFLGWEGLGITSFILIIFYQNWVCSNGGLLTLLTNRMGDIVLILSASYWILSWTNPGTETTPLILSSTLLLTSITNSAQWPFVSWLPAAIAAPTPISALVHSSTLVAAGIWLLVRFSFMGSSVSLACLWLGLITSLLASLAALVEADLNNVVAISTLSQLGLITVGLSLSNNTITLIHICTHAIANANLFLVVGTILYLSSANQDYRNTTQISSNPDLSLSMLVSVLCLTGVTFTSGFYSNEQILCTSYTNLSSSISVLVLWAIVTLTVAYCLNISNSITISTNPSSVTLNSVCNTLPIFPLVAGSLMVGSLLLQSIEFSYPLLLITNTSSMWTLLPLAILLNSTNNWANINYYSLFILTNEVTYAFNNGNGLLPLIVISHPENIMLQLSLNLTNLLLPINMLVVVISSLVLLALLI